MALSGVGFAIRKLSLAILVMLLMRFFGVELKLVVLICFLNVLILREFEKFHLLRGGIVRFSIILFSDVVVTEMYLYAMA